MAKKKNTYSIKFSHLVNYTMFELCRETPLVIAKKNGAVIQQNSNWEQATPFPNTGALTMGLHFKPLKEHIGEKLATTIIEYLDKETNQPVVTLFPTYIHIHNGYSSDFQKHLNHASRKDLAYQILMCRQAFEKSNKR